LLAHLQSCTTLPCNIINTFILNLFTVLLN
jgi:hypothetical protein